MEAKWYQILQVMGGVVNLVTLAHILQDVCHVKVKEENGVLIVKAS
jgi:hypothetical protein